MFLKSCHLNLNVWYNRNNTSFGPCITGPSGTYSTHASHNKQHWVVDAKRTRIFLNLNRPTVLVNLPCSKKAVKLFYLWNCQLLLEPSNVLERSWITIPANCFSSVLLFFYVYLCMLSSQVQLCTAPKAKSDADLEVRPTNSMTREEYHSMCQSHL